MLIIPGFLRRVLLSYRVATPYATMLDDCKYFCLKNPTTQLLQCIPPELPNQYFLQADILSVETENISSRAT
jgi:hypothetical protein